MVLMNVEGLFDFLTHFARCLCAIVIANPSAKCRGLHGCTMRCIHTSQRCISSTKMTDNIFEVEITALVRVVCAPQESGVLLTDFAAAYPIVNHSRIFPVLENTGCPAFLCRFLRSVHSDNITHVEFAFVERGQFLMARGVRQGCLASGFLVLQWLLTRSSDGSKSQISQGTPTTWSSYSLRNALTLMTSPLLHPLRGLMIALALAFFRGLHRWPHLNYRKCCWVQCGTEGRDSLRTWISENCDEFHEMQIVRHAKLCWKNSCNA